VALSPRVVAELSFTEKQQHSVWVSRSKLPERCVKLVPIIVILFGHHGGATGGARDMSKGALAPVGPRVESPLMACVVAMFTTMIKAPLRIRRLCLYSGYIRLGRMVHIEPHHD
jgi:hypothetical protein